MRVIVSAHDESREIGKEVELTRRYVVTFLDRDVCEEFEDVNRLEDIQPLPDRVDADVLQCRVVEVDEYFAGYAVFYKV